MKLQLNGARTCVIRSRRDAYREGVVAKAPSKDRAKIITVASSKGGSGKTSITSMLGVRAASDGRVILLDADPQKSLGRWAELRDEWGKGTTDAGSLKVTVVAGDLAAAIDKANADGADFIFIDTPPALLTRIEAAVAVADLVLVPSQATALDVEAVGATCDIARKYNRPFVFVLNRIEARSKRNAEAEAYLKVDGQVLASRIGNRESYAAAVTTGRSGPELRDLTAKAEIDALWAEVRRLLGAKTRGTVRA